MTFSPVEESLALRDDITLFFRLTVPPAPGPGSGALVLITHGFGEHSARYWHVRDALLAHGFAVATYDLRGHGRSTGRRGDAPAFGAFLDDLARVLEHARRHPALPEGAAGRVFLFGHSMGGLITLRFLEENRACVDGAVVASPWIRLAFEPAWWKRGVARLARYICPGLRMVTGLDPTRLSHDEAFLAAMPDLHLSHHTLSVRLYDQIIRASAEARRRAGAISPPLLLLHGQQDPVTSWRATAALFETVPGPDKILKLYPDTLHETHNDLGREQVLADVTAWLVSHSTASGGEGGGPLTAPAREEGPPPGGPAGIPR